VARIKLTRVKLKNKQLSPSLAVGAHASTPAASGAVLGGGLSPFVRVCIAVGLILAAAGGVPLLLGHSATDPVATAIPLPVGESVNERDSAPSIDGAATGSGATHLIGGPPLTAAGPTSGSARAAPGDAKSPSAPTRFALERLSGGPDVAAP